MQPFDSVMVKRPNRNYFKLHHDKVGSGKMGQLIPVMCVPVEPSAKVDISQQVLLRFPALLAPVFAKIELTVHSFFVPNRLLWPDWEDFITQNNTGLAHPYFNGANTLDEKHVGHYVGIPAGAPADMRFNPMMISAYRLIWNEYYRDQNLQSEKQYELQPGDNPLFDGYHKQAPLLRNWKHDYFTSCLPTAQKGSGVTIPLAAQGTVDVQYRVDGDPNLVRNATNGNLFGAGATLGTNGNGLAVSGSDAVIDPNGQMFVDLGVNAAQITDLRRAFKLQEYLELLMRGGSRYTEYLQAMFPGVRNLDARLQRPEYIGGSKSVMSISEVVSTADTTSSAGVDVGYQAGHAIGVLGGNRSSYYAQEHGWIISILSVMPMPFYQNQAPKWAFFDDNLDYFIPQFQHIGEEAVLNKEIYANAASPDGAFGYLPRYSWMRHINSSVSGEPAMASADYWTLSRKFSTEPGLNSTFIECNSSNDGLNRIFAVQNDDDHMFFHCFNMLGMARPLAKYGNPHL